MSRQNGRDCRCISTWSSNTKFLHLLYKRTFRIMRGRLGKMLLILKTVDLKYCIFINVFEYVFLFIVLIFYSIYSHESFECQLCRNCTEFITFSRKLQGVALIYRISHSACKKTIVYYLV